MQQFFLLSTYLHIIFSSNDIQTCIDDLKDDNLLSVNNNTASDTFTFEYSRCWRKLNKIKCSKKCCKECRKDSKTCCYWCKNIFTCFFSFISALFPITPFVCFLEKNILRIVHVHVHHAALKKSEECCEYIMVCCKRFILIM